MRIFNKVSAIAAEITLKLCILFAAIMTIVVIVGVFFRYVLNNPISWAGELARYLMVSITFLGSSLAIRNRSHAGLTFFLELMPKKIRLIILQIGHLLIIGFLLVMLYESFKLAFIEGPTQLAPTLRIPMTYAFASLPIGATLMILQEIRIIIEDLNNYRELD